MFNKELEAGMLAINIRLDNLQKSVDELMYYMKCCKGEIDLYKNDITATLQDIDSKLAEVKDEPFKTKEGLFNYKQRKIVPTEE